MSTTIDASRLTLLLNELRLPAIKHLWQQFVERSDKEGWPAARLLMALAEHEIAERDRRRIERHLGEAKLPADKILDNFDFTAVPMISKAQVSALCAGDGWLDKGANLLLSARPAAASRIWLRGSACRSSRKAGGYYIPAPPISYNACKSHAASSA